MTKRFTAEIVWTTRLIYYNIIKNSCKVSNVLKMWQVKFVLFYINFNPHTTQKVPVCFHCGNGACACLWYENLASLGIEKYIEKALRADAKTIIEMLIDKVILYDERIEIHYKYTDKNPDETLTELHRDFFYVILKWK